MKRVYHFAAIILIAFSSACNNSSNESNAASSSGADNTTNNALPAQPEPEAVTLITKSDCGTCHNSTAKIVGPSYTSIAEKYPNTAENVSLLADRVIKGGSGVWSTVPMTPHANLQKKDAEKMVSYILSMAKK